MDPAWSCTQHRESLKDPALNVSSPSEGFLNHVSFCPIIHFTPLRPAPVGLTADCYFNSSNFVNKEVGVRCQL